MAGVSGGGECWLLMYTTQLADVFRAVNPDFSKTVTCPTMSPANAGEGSQHLAHLIQRIALGAEW